MTNTNVNPIAALIAGAMRDENAAQSRSASLIEIMFENETNYSREAIASVLKLEGAKLTEAIDNALCELSPEFKAIKDREFAIKEVKAAERSEDDKFQLGVYAKQLRAGRILYQRAMTATYGLRVSETPVIEINLPKRKTGGIVVTYNVGQKKLKGGKEAIATKDVLLSVNKLISDGDAALRNSGVKAKRKETTQARNPVSNLADAAKALAATMNAVPSDKPYEDTFEGEVAANLDNVFARMFLMRFFDGNTLDIAAVKDYAKEVLERKAALDKAVSNGIAKAIKEEKAA